MNRKFGIGALVILGLGVVVWLALPKGPLSSSADAVPSTSVLTVDVVQAQAETWPQTLRASGPLEPWQEVIISPETGGLRIAELLVDVGETVKRGQLLLRLADDSVRVELSKQEAALAQAQANFDQAASNRRRAEVVQGSGALSDQQIDDYRISESTTRASLASAQAEVEASKLKLTQTRVVAADDGVVSSKTAVLGNVVSAGAELFRLVRQGRIEWRPELDARRITAARPGQSAHITLPSGESVTGTVRTVAPTLSTSSARAIVYVSLPKQSAARAGVFASGTIELESTAALTLPQSAIVLRDGRAYVYVLEAGDKVASRVVTTGRRKDDRIEVLTGVDASARVVASGGAFLSEGAQVTVASAPASQVRAEPAP